MNRPVLAAAALLAVACSTGPTTVGLRLNEPSAIVAYNGIAPGPSGQVRTDVRPLLAVASRRGDELRLIDPTTDQPIFGPGIVFPLSIPTAPRPQLLASANLGDGKADLLVAVSAGSTSVQVIETWTETGRVARVDVPSLDDPSLLGPGAEILSVLGVPVAGGARLLVGATGGRLVVLQFRRAAANDAVELDPGSPPTVKPIGFDAADITLLPADPALPLPAPLARRVFLASRDAVGTTAGGAPIFGMAEIDGAADVTLPLTVTPIDTRASTVAVAAGWVDERLVESTVPCSPYTFQGVRQPRVYAALDELRCGPDQPIACGIATVDLTSGQLATDLGSLVPPAAHPGGPVPAQTYRAPMPVFGVPLHIAIGYAPAGGFSSHTTDLIVPSGCPTSSPTVPSPTVPGTVVHLPLLRLQPSAGSIDTSAVAMVTSTDGRVYWYDLSRSAPVNEVDALLSSARVVVTSASTSNSTAGTVALGLWKKDSGVIGVGTDTVGTNSITVDPAVLPIAIETWPGFTERATWSLTWQGGLPTLQRRAGVIAANAVGPIAAFQTATATGFSVVAAVADPALGVHIGDILELPNLGCETTISAVLPAGDPALAGLGVPFAGGAVQLAPATCLPAPTVAVPAVPETLTVRASGLVLVNDHSGYMGRPKLATSIADPAFTFAWSDETALQGEDLALARKARRFYYPIDAPCPIPGAASGTQGAFTIDCYSGFPILVDPLSPGPALRLRAGATLISAAGAAVGTPSDVPPSRDTTLTFVTSDGLTPTFRAPTTGGALPSNLAVVDPTGFSGHQDEAVRFYVPYADDQVFEFTAAGTTTQVTSLR